MSELHDLLDRMADLEGQRRLVLDQIRSVRDAAAADLAAADAALSGGSAPPPKPKRGRPPSRNGPPEPPAAVLGEPRPELLRGQDGPEVQAQRARVMAQDCRDHGSPEAAAIIERHLAAVEAEADGEPAPKPKRAPVVRNGPAAPERSPNGLAELPAPSPLAELLLPGQLSEITERLAAVEREADELAAAVPVDPLFGAPGDSPCLADKRAARNARRRAAAAAVRAARGAEPLPTPRRGRPPKPQAVSVVPMARAVEMDGSGWTNSGLMSAATFLNCSAQDLVLCNRCNRGRAIQTQPCPCGSPEYRFPGALPVPAPKKRKGAGRAAV